MAALLGRWLQRSLIAFRAGGQGAQQIAQFPQRPGGDQRGTGDEGGAGSVEHPRGQRASSAVFQLNEDDVAIWKFLPPTDWQALPVKRVPAVVNRDYFELRKMMGIMRLVRRLPTYPTKALQIQFPTVEGSGRC